MQDVHGLSLAEAAKLIESRKLSPVELVRALLSRIDTFDPQVNAFITVTGDLALAQARSAEKEISAGHYRGPLHGVPVGIKDIYNTAGIRTTGHSKICSENVPAEDAAAVTKLYDAGAVLMGKLATHEFAHGGPSFDLPWPPARNPWNLERFTGGSSSGSAAAVASGFVLGALGSDTGGSIRGPASHCGVAGFMPTYGLVRRHGVIPGSFTLDRCGPLACTVEDCAMLLQVIAGFDPRDAASIEQPIPDYRAALDGDIRGLRIGVVRHFWEQDLAAGEELREALEDAIKVFSNLGAKIEDCRMRSLQDYHDVKKVIVEVEVFTVHHRSLIERAGDFGVDFLGRVLPACLFQASDYVQASRRHRRLILETASLFEKHDVLLTAAMGPAPLLEPNRTIDAWRKPNVTTPFNITGGPALALCIGFSSDGLPLGMQVAGRPFDDVTVLKVGHAYERATEWRARKPTLALGAGLRPPVGTLSAPAVAPAPEPATRVLVEAAARHAGLVLNDAQFAQICAAAPYVFDTARRLNCADVDDASEPANVFRFPARS